MVDRSFERANKESRERLARLAASLTPAQLEIDLGEGWTVASSLGHAGFWDAWQAERWQRTLAGDWSADDASILEAEHVADRVLHAYWERFSARDAGTLAAENAARLDALVASAPDELVEKIDGHPYDYLLHRHRHRTNHLDHIERTIAEAQAKADAEVATDFVAKNAASRRRLAAIVERLRVEDLALPTEPTEEGSWTIAQVLAHLLFWDRSMACRWRRALAQAGGEPIDMVGIPGEYTDAVNDPLAELTGAWTGRLGLEIGAQALAAAEDVDRLAEENVHRLAPGVLSTRPNAVVRYGHRDSHLQGVEKALAAARPAAASIDRGYVARNDEMRDRLGKLYAALTPADLARPVAGEWTVGQHIGHLAFWDRFHATRWQAALAGQVGDRQPSNVTHEVSDLLNVALPPTWAALASVAPDALLEEARSAMAAIDSLIANLPADVPVESILAQRPFLLDRSAHRREHLAQIEKALGR